MPRYIRGVEWADRSTDSRYPLIPLATAADTQNNFEIPNDLLAGLYLAIPADLLLNPGMVFISRIVYAGSLTSIYISAEINSELVEIGQFDVSSQVVVAQKAEMGYGMFLFAPAEMYYDIKGRLLVGSVDGLSAQPQGEFLFTYNDAGLDPDCIRPHLRHVHSVELEQNGGLVNLTGKLRLAGGQNMRLRLEVEDGEPVIYLDALDPSDLNEQLECDYGARPPIRTVNGLSGDSQRQLTLVGSRCLEVIPLNSELQLRNRCSEPCASCEEAEAVRTLIDPFNTQIPTLVNLLNRLDAAITATQYNVLASRGGQSDCAPGAEP